MSGSQNDSVARIDLELILIHCLGLTTLLPKQDRSSVHKKGQGPQMATWFIKVFIMDGEQVCWKMLHTLFLPWGFKMYMNSLKALRCPVIKKPA